MAKLTVWLATSVKSKPLSVLWKEDLCNYHPGTELGFRRRFPNYQLHSLRSAL
jgi:hypothetical protein